MAERKRLSDILLNSERERLEKAWATTKAADDLKPVPAGEYRCRVVNGEPFTARSGTAGYQVTFVRPDAVPDVCLDGEAAGHRGTPPDCPVCLTAVRMRRGRGASGDAPDAAERWRRGRTRAAIAESKAARERPSELLRWIAEAVAGSWHPAIDAQGDFTPEADDG